MDDDAEIIAEFLVESHENLDQLDRDLVELEQQPGSRELLASIFRTIHTIKGTSGFLAFPKLESVTHAGESLLARLRDGTMSMTPATTDALLRLVDTVRDLLAEIARGGTEGDVAVTDVVNRITAVLVCAETLEPAVEPVLEPAAEEETTRRTAADASIRVDVELLDTLMRLVGELVLTRNQIVRQTLDHDLAEQDLVRSSQRLNAIATELQEGVMKTRMQPIDHLWSKLPRVVRDLGAQCGKRVTLAMVGKETELDRSLLEAVKDPLTHLVRNAVDHGVEPPEQRAAAGKPTEGLVTLRARHERDQVVVEVCDDGAGIDPDEIAANALDKGLRTVDQLAQLAPADLLQLVFLPGFSTAAAVSNVSGRGVGMDVVKTNIEGIGGTIEVESVVGRGTTCRLRIPLTLAIVPALTIECSGDRYAIPQVSVLELVALDVDRAVSGVEDVNGAPVYRLRGSLLPLVHLSEVFGVDSDRRDGHHLLIAVLQAEGRRFGLVIDRVLSAEEIVVKPLDSRLKALGTYSGATILGDGRVALILDVAALARRVLRGDGVDRQNAEQTGTGTVAGSVEPNRVLVAGIGGGRQVAIPLCSVTRLEHIPAAGVERVGSREVLQYRGQILPLVRLARQLGSVSEREGTDLVVVVYSSEGRSVAIAVDEILDIVEGDAEVRSDIDDVGLLGSAVVRDRIVELLDVRAAILAADPAFYSARHGHHEAHRALQAAR